ncbi:MAG: hypothetical protein QW429_01575, partial [Thermoprotei archaeon]
TSSQTQTPAPTPAPTYGPVSGGFGVSSNNYSPMPIYTSMSSQPSVSTTSSGNSTVWKLALGLGPLLLAWVFAKPIRRHRRRGISRRIRRYRLPIRRRRRGLRSRRLRR